jgi:hypothetical protein
MDAAARWDRVFRMKFSALYPLYLTKVEKKGRTRAELDQVIGWLTGLDPAALAAHLDAGTTVEGLFAAGTLHPCASKITGVVCGVRVEELQDPLMQKVRYLDKLVDELAKGWKMERILRG